MLRAIMDISARAFSLPDRPRSGHLGHQCSHAPGRPILHFYLSSRRPRLEIVDRVTSSLAPDIAQFLCSSQGPFLRPGPQNVDRVARRGGQGRPSRMACGWLRRCQAAPCMRPFKSSPISQHSSLSSSQFLCSTWNPVSSPRPIRVGRRRAQGLSGPAVAPRWPPLDVSRPSLDSLEHVGTLVVVGMTRPRGARCQGTMDSRRNLVSGGSQ